MERNWMVLLPELMGGLLMVILSYFGGGFGGAYRFMGYIGAGLVFAAIARLDNFVGMGSLALTWSLVANALAMACYIWAVVLAVRLGREARGHRS